SFFIFSQKTSMIPTAITLPGGNLRGKQTVAIKNMSTFPKYDRFEDPSSGMALTWPNLFSSKTESTLVETTNLMKEITNYQHVMNKNQDLIQDALHECGISEDDNVSYC
ncbi:MAG: hypothetical protein H7835_20470, partial [Magnetococcus sp. XQGC-1]